MKVVSTIFYWNLQYYYLLFVLNIFNCSTFNCLICFQIVLFAAFLALAVAAPQHNPDADAVVVRSELDNIGVEGYKYG